MQTAGQCSVTSLNTKPTQRTNEESNQIPNSECGIASTSSSFTPVSENQPINDMEMADADHIARAQKRAISSASEDSSSLPQSKSKKSQPKSILKESILEKAISTAALSSPSGR